MASYLSCISEGKMRRIPEEIHDEDGHWVKAETLTKLREVAYWPGQQTDVRSTIHFIRSQSLHFIKVNYSLQLIGMKFIDPLEINLPCDRLF
jgi:hypothetical protein